MALAVVAFVLLIACANVSNLMLVRALGRRHEMSVRLAIGAARSRLLRQLFTESLILSAFAAGGGCLMAYWCRNLLALLLPARGGINVFLPGGVDLRVLAISVAVSILATLLFGLAPALQTTRIDLAGALKAEAGGVVGGGRRTLIRSGLVLVQVALSFVMLVGGGLLFQNLRKVQNTSPGFSTSVLTTWIDFAAAGYTPQRIRTFQDDFVDRLQSIPGIRSAVFIRTLPFAYRAYSTATISVEGYETAPGEQIMIDCNQVGPAYFGTMGIPIVSGREFTRADNETAPLVAVVDEGMAARYWRGRDPVGSRFQVDGKWVQVVGIAKNAKYRSLTEVVRPFFYVPMRQGSPGGILQLKTALAPKDVTGLLNREIRRLDANLAAGEVITMREQVDRTTAFQRLAVTMLAVFGAMALALASIGLYGVMRPPYRSAPASSVCAWP